MVLLRCLELLLLFLERQSLPFTRGRPFIHQIHVYTNHTFCFHQEMMTRGRIGPGVASIWLLTAYVGPVGLCHNHPSWRNIRLGFQSAHILASSVFCNFWQSQPAMRKTPKPGRFTPVLNFSVFSTRLVSETDNHIFLNLEVNSNGMTLAADCLIGGCRELWLQH